MKQDIFDYSKTSFSDLTEVLKEITEELQSNIAVKDSRVEINFQTNGKYECQLTLAGDTLIFQMHTNVFIFDDDHLVFKNPYVIEDRKRAYCGIINVYNFLADSFRYNRMSDVGYLIGRIFINKDKHYFVEGPRKI